MDLLARTRRFLRRTYHRGGQLLCYGRDRVVKESRKAIYDRELNEAVMKVIERKKNGNIRRTGSVEVASSDPLQFEYSDESIEKRAKEVSDRDKVIISSVLLVIERKGNLIEHAKKVSVEKLTPVPDELENTGHLERCSKEFVEERSKLVTEKLIVDAVKRIIAERELKDKPEQEVIVEQIAPKNLIIHTVDDLESSRFEEDQPMVELATDHQEIIVKADANTNEEDQDSSKTFANKNKELVFESTFEEHHPYVGQHDLPDSYRHFRSGYHQSQNIR